ncbi:hypothetical protein BBJ28_00012266 [Nothophytophthora sp. Chile5]|nr:hypothetical protein BBJ28_00012266 [Nothophytophthora sp. Chile5]
MTFLDVVTTGDLGAIEQELTRGADVNATDATGSTALMWAVDSGRNDVLQLLLDHNPSMEISNRSGRDVLALAKAKGDVSVVALLHEYQRKRLKETLDELPGLCEEMEEVCEICQGILRRLQTAHKQLKALNGEAAMNARANLSPIVYNFHSLLLQHSKKTMLERLVGTRTVIGLLRELHCDIDGIADLVAPNSSPLHQPWQEQWENEVATVETKLINGVKAIIEQLQLELDNPSLQVEVLTLLVYESVEHSSHYSPEMRAIFESVMKKVIRFSRLRVPEVADWFIPEYEVQRQSHHFAFGSFGKVYRGTWLESKVVIKCVDPKSEEDKRTFRREARIWHKARHRHIVNFFGACDQGNSWFFVCEEATNGKLKNYLYQQKKKGRSLAWRKMYEVALGLHFLHQRHIIHNDLKGNQILVSAEGVAMLTDFGLSFMSAESRPLAPAHGAVRWKAPECLKNSEIAPTPESDIYSLGMCIIEAVTGEFPWGTLPDAVVMFHVNKGMPLPRPQEFESDEQWKFVKELCAPEPSSRLKLSDAIRKLKKFAAEEADAEYKRRITS